MNYGISDFETMQVVTEGLQDRDGLRFARQWAAEHGAVLLWNAEGRAWRVESDGSFVGWDVTYDREVASADPHGA